MTKRNPKQEGSVLYDCKTQIGKCPLDCNQCFYNRQGICPDCDGQGATFYNEPGERDECQKCKGTGIIDAFYIPIDQQILPTVEEVGNGIVRANCGGDSNIGRDQLIEFCKRFKNVFYNTSIPKFDFPSPVVFTANRDEETSAFVLQSVPKNLMYVRLRVSVTNLIHVQRAVEIYCLKFKVPVVLTFMAYYENPPDYRAIPEVNSYHYEYKVRHINPYWCPTKRWMQGVLDTLKPIGGRLLTMCGRPDSYRCRDCRNCETYYLQTIRHMEGI